MPSSMTGRENIIWFDLHEDEQSLKTKVAQHPHSKFSVCNEDIDHIIGYVDSKDLLNRVLANQSMALNSGVQIRNTLIVPDTLTLSGSAGKFQNRRGRLRGDRERIRAGGGHYHPSTTL